MCVVKLRINGLLNDTNAQDLYLLDQVVVQAPQTSKLVKSGKSKKGATETGDSWNIKFDPQSFKY
jgi:hypothetical protein